MVREGERCEGTWSRLAAAWTFGLALEDTGEVDSVRSRRQPVRKEYGWLGPLLPGRGGQVGSGAVGFPLIPTRLTCLLRGV